MGFSQRATVLTLYAIQIILGSIALAMVRADVQQFFALLAIVAVFFVGFAIFLYLGELIEHGPATELFENPKEELTKEYLRGVIS